MEREGEGRAKRRLSEFACGGLRALAVATGLGGGGARERGAVSQPQGFHLGMDAAAAAAGGPQRPVNAGGARVGSRLGTARARLQRGN